ncbi:MAG: hypothetical protein XXXJIFNMEKO3_LKCDNKCA_00036 (plasmid) [Candidatus Erwinia impunctatus]
MSGLSCCSKLMVSLWGCRGDIIGGEGENGRKNDVREGFWPDCAQGASCRVSGDTSIRRAEAAGREAWWVYGGYYGSGTPARSSSRR